MSNTQQELNERIDLVAKQAREHLQRVLGNTATKQFSDHLDTCQRCANQPFNLCPIGVELLHKYVASI